MWCDIIKRMLWDSGKAVVIGLSVCFLLFSVASLFMPIAYLDTETAVPGWWAAYGAFLWLTGLILGLVLWIGHHKEAVEKERERERRWRDG